MKTTCILIFSLLMACSGEEESAEDLNAAASALQGALEEAAAEAAEAVEEEAAEAAPAAEATGTRYTCNQAESHQCYQTTPAAVLVTGEQAGCEAGGGGTWTEDGECPTENLIGTCQKERNNETRYFYEGVTAEQADMACTAFGGTFTAAE